MFPRNSHLENIIADDGHAEYDVEAEADVADEMRDFTDIFVVMSPIGHAAEQGGNKDRKHIDEHDEIETLAVQRRHTRKDERHDQNGELDTQILKGILEIGGPQEAYDMHKIKGYQ